MSMPWLSLTVTNGPNLGSYCSITIYDSETRRSDVVHCNASSRVCYLLMAPSDDHSAISFFLANNTGCFISSVTVGLWIQLPTLRKPHLSKYGPNLYTLLFLLRIPFSSKIFSSFEKYLLWDNFKITDSATWTEFR